MYHASPDATEDEAERAHHRSAFARCIGTSRRWAPEDRIKDYQAAHPKFGMFGSIKHSRGMHSRTGRLPPHMFTWMIHIFPYEPDFKEVFSMNDDGRHVIDPRESDPM